MNLMNKKLHRSAHPGEFRNTIFHFPSACWPGMLKFAIRPYAIDLSSKNFGRNKQWSLSSNIRKCVEGIVDIIV